MMPVIEIKHCGECKAMKTTPDYSDDSFNRPEKWLCSKADDRVITTGQEWSDPKPDVPSWCPLSPSPREPPKPRLWDVTATFRRPVAGVDADEAANNFLVEYDFLDEADLKVIERIYGQLPQEFEDWDEPIGGDQPIDEYLEGE
jgi:hypothetical protein